ncbi:unnamed protein product [Lathyrus oleraceus]
MGKKGTILKQGGCSRGADREVMPVMVTESWRHESEGFYVWHFRRVSDERNSVRWEQICTEMCNASPWYGLRARGGDVDGGDVFWFSLRFKVRIRRMLKDLSGVDEEFR